MNDAVKSFHCARAMAVRSGGGGAGGSGGCREQPLTAASAAMRATMRKLMITYLFEHVGYIGIQPNQHFLRARRQQG